MQNPHDTGTFADIADIADVPSVIKKPHVDIAKTHMCKNNQHKPNKVCNKSQAVGIGWGIGWVLGWVLERRVFGEFWASFGLVLG